MDIRIRKQPLFKAMTVRERAEYLKNRDRRGQAPQATVKRPPEKIRDWQAQYPYSQTRRFEEKLAILGVTEEQFEIILGNPSQWAGGATIPYPAWIEDLAEAYAGFSGESGYLSETFKSQIPLAVFFDCVEPLVSRGRQKLRDRIRREIGSETIDSATFDPDNLEHLLTFHIGFILFELLNRTMVLELNVSRMKNDLKGETPEERFADFMKKLRRPGKIESLVEEYPVMFRQVLEFTDRWVEISLELVQRLYRDWEEIRDTFGIRQLSPLKKIQHSAGDRHKGGRTVTIITFASGQKVVYKPRSMAVDIHFQALLGWFNDRRPAPQLKKLKIIDKKEYGWVEFVEHLPCRSIDEVNRYHQRLGHLIAILYMINATDFHSENIIACGEQPVLVDLESLFNYSRRYQEESATAAVHNVMERSVLKINILPFKFYFDEKLQGIDLGGVVNLEGRMSPNPVAAWSAEGTDEMKLTRKYLPMKGHQNYPRYTGGEIRLTDHVDTIENGFREGYDFILKNRHLLLSEDSVLTSFAGDQVRILLRPTVVYNQLLGASFHPDFLRDQAERDLLFEKIHEAMGEAAITPRIIDIELAALQRMDIPIFSAGAGSRDLTADNGESIPGFFQTSGMDDVRLKLQNIGPEDREKQCWFIRASLACSLDARESIHRDTYVLEKTGEEANSVQLLDAARAVADRLGQLAVRFGRAANWTGMFLKTQECYEIRPLAIDMYSGLTGVALFLGYLSKLTGEPRYVSLFEECHHTLAEYYERYLETRFTKFLGTFDGWGGIIYTLAHLGILLDKPALLTRAEQMIDLLARNIDCLDKCDVISGHAGLILVLAAFYSLNRRPELMDLMIRLGDKLVKTAVPMPEGKGWIIASRQPLAGFAHGAAGIAYSLFRLSELTGEQRFSDLVTAAIAYERSLFLPRKGNWRDLRDLNVKADNISHEKVNMVAWCTGAAGVGMGRLGILRRHEDSRMLEEVHVAIATTLEAGFGSNHSLCHGDLGNLDFLLSASIDLKMESLRSTVYRLARAILNSMERRGHICGVPLGVENPGLMTGISGIGYQMLRLADPHAVPSVLLLAPPAGRSDLD